MKRIWMAVVALVVSRYRTAPKSETASGQPSNFLLPSLRRTSASAISVMASSASLTVTSQWQQLHCSIARVMASAKLAGASVSVLDVGMEVRARRARIAQFLKHLLRHVLVSVGASVEKGNVERHRLVVVCGGCQRGALERGEDSCHPDENVVARQPCQRCETNDVDDQAADGGRREHEVRVPGAGRGQRLCGARCAPRRQNAAGDVLQVRIRHAGAGVDAAGRSG